MQWTWLVLFLVGFYPWIRAWRVNWHTSLRHALGWGIAAWIGWGLSLAALDQESLRYLALSLTGCAGVAVLGARRPHVGAWNFVVLGLLAVLVLPLLEGLVLGPRPFDPLRTFFIAATLLVSLANYLPTRLGPVAFLLGLICGLELFQLTGFETSQTLQDGRYGALVLPWIALLCWRKNGSQGKAENRLWLDFRDRYGVLWSLRVREQFNQAAYHAGLPLVLSWQGFQARETASVNPEMKAEAQATLQALLKRFGDNP